MRDNDSSVNRDAPAGSTGELSLVDLLLIVTEHRRVFFVVMALAAAAGTALAFLQPARYTYSASIEIGSKLEGDRRTTIESPSTVLAKLRETYVPMVIQRHKAAHPEDAKRYDVTALQNMTRKTRVMPAEFIAGTSDVAHTFRDWAIPLVGELPEPGRLSDFPVPRKL